MSPQGRRPRETAYEAALRLLGYRPRSADELRRRLHQKGHPAEAIVAALEQLAQAGLVDDRAFAAYWTAQRTQFRPRSPQLIAAELRQLGVGPDAVEAAIATVDEDAAARQAAARWLRTTSATDYPTLRTGLGGYLARRGFRPETIRAILRECWADQPTPGTPDR
jgi:regulatory protein